MITAMFKSMSPLGDKDEVLTRRIGEKDNEMDPVGLLYPADKSIAAIVFPIAETLKQVRSLASSDESRPLLLVNPQWRLVGQVVSDFGFGPWRRQAEEFVDTFETTYTLIEQRVGEASNVTSSSGGVVRILKCFPGDWQVCMLYQKPQSFRDMQTLPLMHLGVVRQLSLGFKKVCCWILGPIFSKTLA
jgi:hypothetical protein